MLHHIMDQYGIHAYGDFDHLDKYITIPDFSIFFFKGMVCLKALFESDF